MAAVTLRQGISAAPLPPSRGEEKGRRIPYRQERVALRVPHLWEHHFQRLHSRAVLHSRWHTPLTAPCSASASREGTIAT